MPTVTPNFNWPVPTSVDLVKDGAVAIEALGDAVDASLLDLKGGTTGQVLAKATNTDMDFTWIAADDTNAIQNAIVDAKGDLIAASANDTPARLAAGNSGETLVVDSNTAVGLRWQAPVNANPVLNSAFQVWQRGTSIAVAAGATPYTADRWQFATNANQACVVSRQLTGDSTNLPFIQYAMRVQRNSGQTGIGQIPMYQSFESANAVAYAGKTVTLSFYGRAGANFSAASNNLKVSLTTGTGTDQNLIIAGYTGAAYPISLQNATLTTTWQRFTYTATLSSTLNELSVGFDYTPVGTAGAADYYEVTGVMLEVGSVATPFKTNGATIQAETSACQRYYFRTTATTQYDRFTNYSPAGSTTNLYAANFTLPVQMRVKPTSIDFSNLTWYDGLSVGTTVSTVTISSNATPTNAALDVVTTGMTQYRPVALMSNTTSGFLGIGAEL